jgi:hypothetical protein
MICGPRVCYSRWFIGAGAVFVFIIVGGLQAFIIISVGCFVVANFVSYRYGMYLFADYLNGSPGLSGVLASLATP